MITAGGRTYLAILARDAELAFQRALRSDPSIVEARLRLGRLYQVIGRTKEAEIELTHAERDAAHRGGAASGGGASDI